MGRRLWQHRGALLLVPGQPPRLHQDVRRDQEAQRLPAARLRNADAVDTYGSRKLNMEGERNHLQLHCETAVEIVEGWEGSNGFPPQH